jgi:hypothetical protein
MVIELPLVPEFKIYCRKQWLFEISCVPITRYGYRNLLQLLVTAITSNLLPTFYVAVFWLKKSPTSTGEVNSEGKTMPRRLALIITFLRAFKMLEFHDNVDKRMITSPTASHSMTTTPCHIVWGGLNLVSQYNIRNGRASAKIIRTSIN